MPPGDCRRGLAKGRSPCRDPHTSTPTQKKAAVKYDLISVVDGVPTALWATHLEGWPVPRSAVCGGRTMPSYDVCPGTWRSSA